MSSAQDWMQGIREQGERDRVAREALNTRYDRLIKELDETVDYWYMNYPDGQLVAKDIMAMMEADEGRKDHYRQSVLRLKRDIVAKHVIPAIHAAIRAGFVKYWVKET